MKLRSFKHNPKTLELYHPLEHAYLSDYLGIERPDCAKSINPHAPEERGSVLDEDEYESDGIFRLRLDYNGEFNCNAIANAIARLALNQRQYSLPQWSNGLTKTRHHEGRCLHRAELEALFLFTINYADSGPGFSWPETYHITLFPHYDVYIVTASQDSPEVHGYVDEAIGFFQKDQSVITGVKPIICSWWPGEMEVSAEYAWQSLWDEGMINAETAYAWRDEVYGLNNIEEEEDWS